jgi:SAM-dependent methyltransferase
MSFFWKRKLERLGYMLSGRDKEFAEIKFWRRQIQSYKDWYNGDLKELYGHPAPGNDQKVAGDTSGLSALLTFFEMHQKVKYSTDLQLGETELEGLKVLDIGSGPFPSGLCFSGCELYCLDPLMCDYFAAGYPMHCYENRAKFVNEMAENMPFRDDYFDAVISVNAIDHVNDFARTALEIKRVLKSGGRFRMHVHYHPKTKAEPLELNDKVFLEHYSWVSNLKRISESKFKTGTTLETDDELYVLWGN